MKAYSYLQLSTPIQRRPVAIKRQIESTKQYCDEIGLELEDLDLDLGVSAFSGSRRKDGVLSRFKELIEFRSDLRPCALIVEDLTWITAQDCTLIIQEFMALIELNVELHTPQTGTVYRTKDFDLIGLVLDIGRALGQNEISQARSMRRRKRLE